MRKGFDSLSGLVKNELGEDPLNGDLYIFFNKRRSQIKLLSWDQDGYAVYHKRLEKGTYELPKSDEKGISAEMLHYILRGVSIKDIVHRKRYSHKALNVHKTGKTSA